jgi:hypothetical protein
MNTHRAIYCRARNNPGSLLIRVGDGMGQWSHCAGILATGEHVIEALAFKGVVVTPLEDVVRRSSAWTIVDREVPNKAKGDAWAQSTVGAGYDYFGALGVPINRDWQDPAVWFCSEHNEMWQQQEGLFRFRPGTRGIGPRMSHLVL